jgi:LuxR family maltose regulon positive regulatory protein
MSRIFLRQSDTESYSMPEETTSFPLVLTKLHRPPVTEDLVPRLHLLEQLERNRLRPLTLVSAAAGYGKSTLVSWWLERCESPFTWLSLDENDNDLHQFLAYFVAAVQSIFPSACSDTMALANAPTMPPIPLLASTLANDLDSIEQGFILVLDDIHRIHEKSVYNLLNMLLDHPPRPMHLVLVGRRDPLLPISRLRGSNRMTEIRTLDLRFSAMETAAYLQRALREQINESTAAAMAERTDGWVTGLRLVVLALRGQHNAVSKLVEVKRNTGYQMDYLIAEVLDNQLPAICRYLLSTSILDRFCVPLCDVLCAPDFVPGEGEIDGEGFITLAQESNMFMIPLDTENEWFRYHHLFQDLLQRQLKRRCGSKEIATLHSRASEWFESQGLITESIKHALAAGDTKSAADIIERHRDDEFIADRWQVVVRWLAMLPEDIRRERPKLLLTEVWIRNLQHQLGRVPMLLDRAESLLRSPTEDPTVAAEMGFFRGYITYFEGQAERSLQYLEDSVSQLAGTKSPFLGEAELMLGLARCMVGKKDRAVRGLKDRIWEVGPSENYSMSRLIASLVFIHLLWGDLHLARREAQNLQAMSRKHKLGLAEAWSCYFLACTHLHVGELEAASLHFAQAVELRYVLEPRAALDALAGLALTQQFMGLGNEAAESCRRLEEFAQELHERHYLFLAQSCQARLSMLRGDLNSAVEWGWSVDESPVLAELFIWLEVPSITQARVLIAAGSEQSLLNATKLLQPIRDLCEAHRFTCQIIEVAVLQSLALDQLGRADEALHALEEVVALAGPRGWIRPFVEAGPPMADLLKRLQKQSDAVGYIERLLAAFREDERVVVVHEELEGTGAPSTSVNPQPLVEPLTNRELEILELLAQRLQNKEIADKLFVSIETVKTHLSNIYQKLQVSNRREADERAKSLGILTRR